MMARRLSLNLHLVGFLHSNVHNNDFGLIFYAAKHIAPDQADFHELILITFDRSGGFQSKKLQFKA